MSTPALVRAHPRWQYAARAVLLGLILVACGAMVIVLGHRTSVRADLTATRQHVLSPRAQKVITGLDRELTLVLAFDGSSVRGERLRRLRDVLDKFTRATPRLKVDTIDTGASEGLARYDALLAELAQKDKPLLDRAVAQTDNAAGTCEQLAQRLSELQPALVRLRDEQARGAGAQGERVRQGWDGQGAELRGISAGLLDAASQARQRLSQPAPPLPVPAVDLAQGVMKKPLEQSAVALRRFGEALDKLAGDLAQSDESRTQARGLLTIVSSLRDRAARTGAELDATRPPRLLLIGRAIQRTSAALLLDTAATPGDPGRSLTALNLDELLGPEGGSDTRARAEAILTGAITSLSTTPKPLVVLVHPVSERLGPDFWPVHALGDALNLRGIDVTEWAVALDPEPPASVSAAHADGSRPVVYVTFSEDVRTPKGALASGKLAEAIKSLLAAGRCVLISVNPSTLPGAGSPDPLVEPLGMLGLGADSGLVILEESRAGAQRAVTPDQFVFAPGCTHPISSGIEGLRTRLVWPVPLRMLPAAPTGVEISPLIVLPPRAELWGESEWQQLRSVPENQRGQLPSLPSQDSPRDMGSPEGGWLVGAAVTRTAPDLPGPQRVVVIGSNLWYLDRYAALSSVVDGKPVAATPGNAELFIASVWWLAGQDEQIARGLSAGASPTIPDLSEAQRTALGWSLIAGGPAIILLIGALWRAWRG